jgi:pimeloyl-ACP methyl ester carboxylesterase
VLLHPVGLDRATWWSLSASLAKDFTVVSCDLPGHGDTPRLQESAIMADYAAAVVALIEHLGLGPVVLLGESFGGMIAQTVAVEAPQHVRALIAVACPARVPLEARQVLAARGKVAQEGGMQAVLQDTLQRWFSPDLMADPAVQAVAERLLSDDVEGWAAAWLAMSQFDIVSRLSLIAVPTLCVAGGKDVSAPVSVMKVIAEGVSGAEFTIIPDAPHMLHIEYPREFDNAVRSFLMSLRR